MKKFKSSFREGDLAAALDGDGEEDGGGASPRDSMVRRRWHVPKERDLTTTASGRPLSPASAAGGKQRLGTSRQELIPRDGDEDVESGSAPPSQRLGGSSALFASSGQEPAAAGDPAPDAANVSEAYLFAR